MDYNKPFNFLKNLPPKLNSFYKKRSKSGLVVSNKSKTKRDFDPVTNFDREFEKYIRIQINKKFPKDSIIGEEFEDKFSSNEYKWSIDPIDGTRAFVIGAPTWSNLISLSFEERSLIGLANFPELDKYYISDKKKSKSDLVVSNKSNSKKDFDPVTNFDKAFEKYIRSLISKKFPKDSIIGEEFADKFSFNDYKWSIDPIDGTRAFVIGAPTWSNLISLSFKERSLN